VRRKISADVDGGLSGVSRCADKGARTPIGVSGISFNKQVICTTFKLISDWELAERQALSLCFEMGPLSFFFHLGEFFLLL
jgi:hypothetical protein